MVSRKLLPETFSDMANHAATTSPEVRRNPGRSHRTIGPRAAKSQRHAARQSGKRITAQELTDPGTLEPCDNLCYCAYGDFSLADMARWIGLPLNQYESITRHMLSTGKREVICDPACQDCEGSGFISSGENDYAQNDRWQKHLRPMHWQRSWSGCSSMAGLKSGTC